MKTKWIQATTLAALLIIPVLSHAIDLQPAVEVDGNLKISTSGKGIIFSDDSKMITAPSNFVVVDAGGQTVGPLISLHDDAAYIHLKGQNRIALVRMSTGILMPISRVYFVTPTCDSQGYVMPDRFQYLTTRGNVDSTPLITSGTATESITVQCYIDAGGNCGVASGTFDMVPVYPATLPFTLPLATPLSIQ